MPGPSSIFQAHTGVHSAKTQLEKQPKVREVACGSRGAKSEGSRAVWPHCSPSGDPKSSPEHPQQSRELMGSASEESWLFLRHSHALGPTRRSGIFIRLTIANLPGLCLVKGKRADYFKLMFGVIGRAPSCSSDSSSSGIPDPQWDGLGFRAVTSPGWFIPAPTIRAAPHTTNRACLLYLKLLFLLDSQFQVNELKVNWPPSSPAAAHLFFWHYFIPRKK